MEARWEAAVRRGDAAAVRDLIQRGCAVDALDRYGQTGLMLAARSGHLEVARLLVEHGADLDVAAKFNLTALMLAVVNRRADVARLLVRAGASLTHRGSGAPGFHGKTARDLALANGQLELATEL